MEEERLERRRQQDAKEQKERDNHRAFQKMCDDARAAAGLQPKEDPISAADDSLDSDVEFEKKDQIVKDTEARLEALFAEQDAEIASYQKSIGKPTASLTPDHIQSRVVEAVNQSTQPQRKAMFITEVEEDDAPDAESTFLEHQKTVLIEELEAMD